jgi:hypothetical protein
VTGIVWEDPPPPNTGNNGPRRTVWQRFAEELKAHPGQWAKIENTNLSVVKALKMYGCEARGVNQKNARCDVYARWPEVAS